MSKQIYFGEWESKSDLVRDFELEDDACQGEILYARYDTPGYEGYAFVLFCNDGKLYEVNGSHCSCYGLEGQWEPEETTIEAIQHRDHGIEKEFIDEILEAVK